MTTTDLKTGDIVQHHEKGRGYVLRHDEGGSVRVIYASQARTLGFDLDLDTDGWERAEIVKPGHVQVRVDDLDLEKLRERLNSCDCLPCRIAHRVCAAANPEPPQPDEPTGLGAVVEVEGYRYVLGSDLLGVRWTNGITWLSWDKLTARGTVTVLSEGIPS